MLLTPQQLQEIKQIISDHHDAFIVNAIGASGVTPERLEQLKELGLVDVDVASIEDAYLYGQLLAMTQSRQVAKMSFDEFKAYLRKNPIPLSDAEHHAVQMAVEMAGQYARGLANAVTVSTGDALLDRDRILRTIRDKTAMNLARRESVSKLKSDLQWATRDWGRNWARIAITEKQNAMQQGMADAYRDKYGDDVLVAKRPMPDACEHCKRVYLDDDDFPRIFRMSVLEENGTNVGRKAKDWRAVIGTVHPHCRCQLIRVPAGWGFDDEGRMVPNGEHRTIHKSVASWYRDVMGRDDLVKAEQPTSPPQGKTELHGLQIVIENKAGTVRRWGSVEGESGETLMQVHYGYIPRTLGADTDEVDVFVGSDRKSESAYVIEQQNPHTGLYDEQKVMLGFPNQEMAEAVYAQHYDRPDFALYTTPMTVDQLKRLLLMTEPDPGSEVMGKSGPPLILDLEKARVSADIAALTSHAANRSPSPGTSPNYIVEDVPPRPIPPGLNDADYRSAVRDLEALEGDWERPDPAVARDALDYPRPPRLVTPIEFPEDWDETSAQAREGHKERMAHLLDWSHVNRGWPPNADPAKDDDR